jgi:hypothetical protein
MWKEAVMAEITFVPIWSSVWDAKSLKKGQPAQGSSEPVAPRIYLFIFFYFFIFNETQKCVTAAGIQFSNGYAVLCANGVVATVAF